MRILGLLVIWARHVECSKKFDIPLVQTAILKPFWQSLVRWDLAVYVRPNFLDLNGSFVQLRSSIQCFKLPTVAFSGKGKLCDSMQFFESFTYGCLALIMRNAKLLAD